MSSWAPGPVKAGAVYRFSVSSRRKPYVDLLVASDKAKKETEVQVAGFSGEKQRRGRNWGRRLLVLAMWCYMYCVVVREWLQYVLSKRL